MLINGKEYDIKPRAYLSHANLSYANLSDAYLTGANLTGAYLSGANLYRADLSGADLSHAKLYRADLSCADLSGANLSGAYLSDANLSGANLSHANLSGAYLSHANLSDAILPHFQICPEVGAFRGWKGALDKEGRAVIIELGIRADAQRTSSLVGRKCRASRVKVLRMVRKSDGRPAAEAFALHDGRTRYVVGEYVTPDSYDPDIRVECTHGIHFFVTRREAEGYV